MPDKCDCLLIKTGFFKHRHDKERYIFHNPGIALEICNWMQKNTDLKMIGFDFISLSSYEHRQLGLEALRTFLAKFGVYGTEYTPLLIIEDMDFSALSDCHEWLIVSSLRFHCENCSPVTATALYE